MATAHEQFWTFKTYAVVGHTKKRAFPTLTYKGLKAAGKQVFAVDPSVKEVEGDKAYDDFASLGTIVDATVLEVPREETAQWVQRAAKAGVGRIWIHQGTDSPEAIEIARNNGLELHSGTCAVMYLKSGFNMHGIHRVLWKALGRY